MSLLTAEQLAVMRTRARHRLLGALILALVLVIGVPFLLGQPDAASDPALAPVAGASRSPAGEGAATPVLAGALADRGAPANRSPAGDPGAGPDRTTLAAPDAVSPVAGAAAAATADPAPGLDALPGAPLSLPTPPPAGAPAPVPATALHHQGTQTPVPMGRSEPREAKLAPRATPEVPVPAAPAPAPAGRAPAVSAPAAPSREARPTVSARPAATGKPERGWFVQYGVFAEAQRAEALSGRLGEHGITVAKELVHGPRGTFARLRSGPFASRAAADEILARARALGENAILVHQ